MSIGMRGLKSEVSKIKEEIEVTKKVFWENYKKSIDREQGYKVEGKIKKVDFVKFENTLKKLENDLWYAKESERIRRNWN